jgi:hypothetical protein
MRIKVEMRFMLHPVSIAIAVVRGVAEFNSGGLPLSEPLSALSH